MSIKLVVLYPYPKDQDAFEQAVILNDPLFSG